MNIGIFDSGLGGLSILKEIYKILPQYNYLYLGDNARVPYGGRSPEVIFQFTVKAVDFLMKQNCGLVIIACNSSTANALRRIQREYLPLHYPKRRVLGVILPVVETAIEKGSKKVGVIGTYATVNSKSFITEFKKKSTKTKIYQQACPLLVPIIEEGELTWDGLPSILKKYLKSFTHDKIDSMILGCTHYGLIHHKIQKILGSKIEIISQGKATGLKLKQYLKRHPEIENKLDKNRSKKYYFTDLNERYLKLIKLFLGQYFSSKDHLALTTL